MPLLKDAFIVELINLARETGVSYDELRVLQDAEEAIEAYEKYFLEATTDNSLSEEQQRKLDELRENLKLKLREILTKEPIKLTNELRLQTKVNSLISKLTEVENQFKPRDRFPKKER